MSQWEYDTILNILQYGAPALFNVLANSLQKLVTEYQDLKKAAETSANAAEVKES